MVMTAEEIARDYRLAASPQKQIGVLADLNACTKREIADVLIGQGCEVPKYYTKKPAKIVPMEVIQPPVDEIEPDAEADDGPLPLSEVLPVIVKMTAFDAIQDALYSKGDSRDFRMVVTGILKLAEEMLKE